MLTIIGACAGSTAGGFKIARLLIVLKGILGQVRQVLRPNSVNVVRLDGEAVPDETVRSAMGYTSLYCVLIVIVTLIVSLDGFEM
jgi:trk system potassium uptake protein TrkH